MKNVILLPFLFIIGFNGFLQAQTPCPDGATITANTKCVFLTWETLPDPLPTTIVIDGTSYSYDSGAGTSSDPAIFRDGSGGPGTCNANQGEVFSGNITIDGEPCTFVDGQLGVEWISFDAKVIDYDVMVTWSVIADELHEKFVIERSQEQNEWYGIHTDRFKISNQIQQYFYLDRPLASGTYYYRVKQFDHSGQYDYSPVLNIKYLNDTKLDIKQRSFDALVEISGLHYDEKVIAFLSGIDGRVYAKEVLTGNNSYELNYNDLGLGSGVYFLTLSTGYMRQTDRLVIQ